MNTRLKNIMLSAVISIAATGFAAALHQLLPSSNQPGDGHDVWYYLLLCAVIFFIVMNSLYQNAAVNSKHMFTRSVIFSLLFLFLAISHFSAHETARDWVFAIVFTIAIPFEVKKAVDSYRNWKSSEETTSKE